MNFRTEAFRSLALALCALAWLPACGSDSDGPDDDDGPAMMGTETDNPNTDPPVYESPSDFTPDQGEPPCPGPIPGATPKPRERPLWGMSGDVLVGAYRYRGLMLVDGSDPSDPKLVGETALHGEVMQLLVESEGQVSVVLGETPAGAHDEVLTPEQLQPQTKLVRFDISDPSAVQRVAEIDLEGDFWSMRQRGSTLWVMSTAVDQLPTSCDRPRYDCGYQDISALIVAGYQLHGGSWERIARVELPMTNSAWLLPDGYAALQAHHDQNGDAMPGTLSFVRFDGDDALSAMRSVELMGEPAPYSPLNLTADLAQLFVLDYMRGNSELISVSLATGETIAKVDDIPQQQFDASFFVGSLAFVSTEASSAPARMIDLSDPSAPVEQSLPAEVSRLTLLEDGRVLGLSDASSQHAYLFAVQDGALVQLADVEVAQDHGAMGWEGVQQIGDRVVLSYRSGQDTQDTVVLEIGESTLTSLGTLATGYADALTIGGDTFYAVDSNGLLVGQLGQDDVQRLQWTHEVNDVVRAGSYQVALARDADYAPVLELTKDGEDTLTLPVSPMAERLVTDGQYVLVLSVQPRDQCEQSGLDCSDYAPNVAVVSLGDAPAITATLPLTDTGSGTIENGWDSLDFYAEENPALALGDGRFALVGRYEAFCQSEAACEALGLEAGPPDSSHVNTSGTAACPPGVKCPEQPAPAAPTAYGDKSAERIWLLDASAAHPRLSAPVESVLERGDSRFGTARVSQGTLLITRIERDELPGQASGSQPAHFMLDRFKLEDDALVAQAAINVPGYPIALAADGALLLTVEPGKAVGAGKLHLLALDDDAATVLDSAAIDATYTDAIEAFGKLFYLRHSSEDCAGVSTLRAFAVPQSADDTLEPQPEIELPGGRYRFADARDDRLLLTDDQGGYIVLDVSGDGAPVLVTFLSDGFTRSHPILDGDHVLGAAGGVGLSSTIVPP